MKKFKYLIIGGGTTAGYAAEEFVEQGIGKGELCIISSEKILPMNRPPFSKQYLKDPGEDDEILINEGDFYDSNGIEVMLETVVHSVDFGRKQVEPDGGEVVAYDKLLITTGSRIRTLDVKGGDLGNIFYLRRKEHSDRIREQAKKSRKAVVVGGGYIGSETAAILSEMGLEVTMIIPEERLLSKFTDEKLGAFFERIYNDHGIELMFGEKVTAFHGNDNVDEVELGSGKKVKTDMVVAGIGVEPDLDLFDKGMLNTRKGIVVNEYCETGVEDVYAAGDVAEFPDPTFDKKRHVEHWENAFEMGKHAARVMTGKREPYIFVPFFFSDIFELSYEYFGDQTTANHAVTRGNTDEADFSHWWFRDNRPVAAFVMSSRPEEEGEHARKWIKNKMNINRNKIGDEKEKLGSLEMQPDEYSDEPQP